VRQKRLRPPKIGDLVQFAEHVGIIEDSQGLDCKVYWTQRVLWENWNNVMTLVKCAWVRRDKLEVISRA
jgi:hypothetical protein